METKKWRKIVFLDIDGVLASTDFLCKSCGKFIDKEKVALLNKLKPYDVEVVISSSWGNNEDTVKELTECGLELPIIGGTDHFHVDWLCRGNEIAKWIYESFGVYNVFTGEVYNYKDSEDYEYVIFDDDADMLMCQKDNFICVDSYTALLEEHIEKAIDILERKILKK
jgi:hypothetical protein